MIASGYTYAMTSADLVRPPVEVYLRGVAEEPAVPETWLAWRRDVEDLVRAGPEAAEAALSFFRPRAAELARVPVTAAKKIVEKALRRQEGRGLPLVVVRGDGEVHAARVHDAGELPSLAYATVFVPCGAGGLAGTGLPDASASGAVADVGDTPDRIRHVAAEPGDEAGDGPELPAWVGAAVELRIPIPGDEDGCEEVTWVYALRRAGADLAIGAGELTWVGGVTQSLEEHDRLVGKAIRGIARALGLEATLVTALGRAGDWHDPGKSRRVWQLAAGVPPGGPALAKSRRGRFRPGWLGGYRHEFGSVAGRRAEPPRGHPAPRPHPALDCGPPRVGAAGVPAAGAVGPGGFAGREPRARGADRGPVRAPRRGARSVAARVDRGASQGCGRVGFARRGRVMEWRIDPENPAEVLACAGLAHLAWRSDRHARTGFVFDDDGEVRFEAPQLYEPLDRKGVITHFSSYAMLEEENGTERALTPEEREDPDETIPHGARVFQRMPLLSSGRSTTGRSEPFNWKERIYPCPHNQHWRVSPEGLDRLGEYKPSRLTSAKDGKALLRWKLYEEEVPGKHINNLWADPMSPPDMRYVVETAESVLTRCICMTTDPGDLVLDPTCGSGTTAYVAEKCGRRWITSDVSGISLALTRHRLITAVNDWYLTQGSAEGQAKEQALGGQSRAADGHVCRRPRKRICLPESTEGVGSNPGLRP